MSDPAGFAAVNSDLESYLQNLEEHRYQQVIHATSVPEARKFDTGWNVFKHKIPTWIFIITCLILTVLSFTKNLSLIPLLGLISCLYMMSEMNVTNWLGFSAWLVVGLLIYFGFSYKNSKLSTTNS
jgi:hypothetical protein